MKKFLRAETVGRVLSVAFIVSVFFLSVCSSRNISRSNPSENITQIITSLAEPLRMYDSESIHKIIYTAMEEQHLRGIVLYDKNSRFIEGFLRNASGGISEYNPRMGEIFISQTDSIVNRDILFNGKPVGKIRVVFDGSTD